MTGVFRVLLILGIAASALPAAPARPTTRPAPAFKYVTVTTDLDETGLPRRMHRKEIYFIGDNAYCVDAEGLPELVIDLKKQSASDEQGNRFSQADLQARFERERNEARQRIEKLRDENAYNRAKYEIDPALAVSEEGDRKIVATNPLVRYEIQTAPVDPQYRPRLYTAVRLLTLAGASATSPPYVPVAMLDELERRGVVAQDARGVTKSGNRQSEVRIQSRVSPLSDEDQKRLATMLLPAGGF